MEIEKTEKGIRRCADFLKCCLDLGWDKSDLYDLESLFWKFKDKNGDLKPKSSSTAAALLSGEDWISVGDRLPEIGKEVLIFEDGTIAVSYYAGKKPKGERHWRWHEWPDGQDEQPSSFNPSHWKPLPEPPKP